MSGLVSELSVIAAREKAMLDECEELLASSAALQVQIKRHLLVCATISISLN